MCCKRLLWYFEMTYKIFAPELKFSKMEVIFSPVGYVSTLFTVTLPGIL